ncbi:hypothetical protein Pcinc_003886 [Petrolisthes cinctipes]|uniref:Uncharacterized protein n=1 Tax=Petrolisthes cinctipes TaxID=88211 RepID=A0AAE1GI18_PETCI|nr:hypothetical protein Pcinc_003886 [Petrolisthes cinctipes]
MRTGGGTPPKKEDDETAKILGIISDELEDLGNEPDSDARQTSEDVPVVIFDYGNTRVEHSYTIEDSNGRSMVTNIADTTPQHTTTSQHRTLTLDDTATPGPSHSTQAHSTGTSSQRN